VGQALDGRAIRQRYGICTAPLPLLRDAAKPSLILDISIHGKKDEEYGDHSRIKEVSGPLDVVGTLRDEFKNQRGQIMVSRKKPPSLLSHALAHH